MTTTDTAPVVLRVNLGDHPVTSALKDGRVSSSIVTLDFCGPEPATRGFRPMIEEGAFDVGEMAIATFLQARAYGKPLVGLAVPVNGRFQHQCAGYNATLGDLAPKDIEGRRVGVRTYSQTTGLWIRGVLQHEYGVDLDAVTWCTTGAGHVADHVDPPNCVRLPAGSDIGRMMLDGELAATLQGKDLPKDPRVAFLVPDPHAAALAWYEREGVIPINHIVVVQQRIVQDRSDVVAELYRMLADARSLAEREGCVPVHCPPFGLEANRKCIALAIAWAHEQHLIPKLLDIDELFSPPGDPID